MGMEFPTPLAEQLAAALVSLSYWMFFGVVLLLGSRSLAMFFLSFFTPTNLLILWKVFMYSVGIVALVAVTTQRPPRCHAVVKESLKSTMVENVPKQQPNACIGTASEQECLQAEMLVTEHWNTNTGNANTGPRQLSINKKPDASSASDTSLSPMAEKPEKDVENVNDPDLTWSQREAARFRQIMIGKARPEYRRYMTEVPPEKRGPQRPHTPDPRARISKRQFDRVLGEWRRALHEFDAVPPSQNCRTQAIPGNSRSPGRFPEAVAQESAAQRQQGLMQATRAGTHRQCAAFGAPNGEDGSSEIAKTPSVVQLRLADELAEIPPSMPQWFVPDRAAVQVTLADKLPDPITMQNNHIVTWAGPQTPVDKMPPPLPSRDEKVFHEKDKMRATRTPPGLQMTTDALYWRHSRLNDAEANDHNNAYATVETMPATTNCWPEDYVICKLGGA